MSSPVMPPPAAPTVRRLSHVQAGMLAASLVVLGVGIGPGGAGSAVLDGLSGPDLTEPRVLGGTVTPQTVSAPQHGVARVVVDVHLTDDSGVHDVLLFPEGPGDLGVLQEAMKLVSGTSRDGIWRQVLTVRRSDVGTYTFNIIPTDVAENSTGQHVGSFVVRAR